MAPLHFHRGLRTGLPRGCLLWSICVAWGILAVQVPVASAQATPPKTVWSIGRGDCNLQIRSRTEAEKSVRAAAHTHFQLQATNGSAAYASFELPGRSPVIAELTVSLPIKASRPGMQLFVRAVLPRSLTDEGPKTILLPGPTYRDLGEWETLTLTNLPELLEQHVRIHRTTSQEWLDAREAFIDLVAVNVFGGKGSTDILLASPIVDGVTLERSRTEVELASIQRLPAARNHQVRLAGSTLRIDDRPFAPRIVRPQGEPWPFLAELGFNTLWLDSTPSAEQVALAEQLDLWLIAHVPAVSDYEALNSHLYRRVLAWDLQTKSPQIDAEPLAIAIQKACGSNGKPLLSRPSFAGPQNHRWSNIVVHGRSPLGTTQPLDHYGTQLHRDIGSHSPGTLHWAQLQTHLPASVQQQIALLERSSAPTSIAVDPNQLKATAIEALARGARAICIADDQRLDGNDLASQIRAATVKKWNQQHAILSPWLLSGRTATIASTESPQLQLAIFATNRSKLALPLQRAKHQQLCDAPHDDQRISITLQHSAEGASVYLVKLDGLEKIPCRRVAGGMRFEIDGTTNLSGILLTPDERIAAGISAKLRRVAKRQIETEQLLAEIRLAETRQAQAGIRTIAAKLNLLSQADRQLKASTSASRTSNHAEAAQQATAANRSIQAVRQEYWNRQLRETSPATCPLAASFTKIGSFRAWQTSTPQAARGVNLLAGSDFEKLAPLLARGWSAQHAGTPNAKSQISLTDRGRHGKCLRIAAADHQYHPGRAFAWVDSAPLEFELGQQVRIDGWVRVRAQHDSTQPTAMIFDSWAGEALAKRWRATAAWQPFTLFRVCTGDPLQVRCALVGPGELLVDDLLISPLSESTFAQHSVP